MTTKTTWFQSKYGRPETDPAKRVQKSEAEKDAKLLTKADADVEEAERREARQITLIAEQRSRGETTAEVEKSLARLEEATQERRAARDKIHERIAAAEKEE